jgi:hypothetical protein
LDLELRLLLAGRCLKMWMAVIVEVEEKLDLG